MNRVVFCSDRVLRYESMFSKDEITFPIVTMESTFPEKDPFYLLRFFEMKVVVEEKTVLSDILFALEPWSALISNYTGINIQAYIEEMRKPSLLETEEAAWINVFRHTIYNSQMAPSKGKTFRERLASPREYTDKLDYKSELEASMFQMNKDGEEKRYSIPDIQKVKNLPVYISGKNIVHGFYKKSNMFAEFNAITHFPSGFGGRGIVASDEVTLREFLLCLLKNGLYNYSPESARRQEAEILEQLELSRICEEHEEKPEPKTEVVSDKESANSNPKPYEIKAQAGFLKGFADIVRYEVEMDEKLKTRCINATDDMPPIKIGQIKEGVAPETFIFNVELNDKE